LGPGAGEEGGQVLFQGPPGRGKGCPPAWEGGSLPHEIPLPSRRRPATHGHLRLKGAKIHNLQDVSVDFPLGVLCIVTGVSGAGKSSLVEDTLYPAICRARGKKIAEATTAEVEGTGQIADVILMDQTPLTRTNRSNPATFLKIF